MIETGVIPAGTTLWHGTAAQVGFAVPKGPAYFSDSYNVSAHFAWLQGPMFGPRFPARVLRYVVVTDISLPVLTHREVRGTGRADFENEVWSTPKWQQFLKAVRKLGAPPFESGTLGDLLRHGVCHNFNGWRIVNNYDIGDDIMLCEPARWLRRVQRRRR